jgi:polyisoprenoid-binding protein YceI
MRHALLAAACLTATACGAATSTSPAAPPTSVSGAPTSAAASAPTAAAATAAPTVAATARDPGAPGAAATASAGGTATSTQTSAAASSSSAAAATLVIDSSSSHASYRAREQLAGRNLPSDAVGTSTAVSGAVVFSADGSIDANQSQVKVDLSKLTSDESRRDNFIKGNTLQTSQFPMATFTARQASGLPTPLPTEGQSTFQLSGDLTVHGVTKPVTWQVTAQFDPNSVSGNATTDVNISDFGMTPPKAGPVLSIQDALTLELAFTAAREG